MRRDLVVSEVSSELARRVGRGLEIFRSVSNKNKIGRIRKPLRLCTYCYITGLRKFVISG